jgi:23S rRNA-/tRNA-specific pseudouridylate synthase
MVLARTSKAASRLTEAFAARRVEKRYLAVVEGRLDGAGERTDTIRKSGERMSIVPADSPEGRDAAMRWRALATDGSRTLVEVELLTGRPHQARLQLAAMGTPVLGDFRHGGKTRFADGGAVALHAWRLALDHPVRSVPCEFEAPPPASWKGLFEEHVGAIVGERRARIDGRE